MYFRAMSLTIHESQYVMSSADCSIGEYILVWSKSTFLFLDDAVRQSFMDLNQRKLFISSFFVDELLDKLEFAKAFPDPGSSYEEFANSGRLDLELHLNVMKDADAGL
ncbi:unnamed protein product [Cuscuta campestris]|uniref:Uncharacterized protein n=1 Tax=Cuscuta campestris TaxID=132261 RepID=A0A484M6F6_9ASTE|nr:unnamed protein product [Cuscuta campestris]